jgi:ABC-type transport system involved in cytochrome c biogenesis permease subunit
MGVDTILSILMLAVIALLLGAFALWRRGGRTKQVVLMLVLAAVVAGNIALWIVPDASGVAPVERAPG